MTYDPLRQKPVSYIKAELEKIWENARSEKAGVLHKTRSLAIKDLQRVIEHDGLLKALKDGSTEEISILRDCMGRFCGSNEERTNFFIDVVTTACKQAKAPEAEVTIAHALWHSTQGQNGLSGISRAVKALEQSDIGEKAA